MREQQSGVEAAPAVLNYEYLAGLERYLGPAHARELLSDGMIDLIGRLDRLAELADRGDSGAIAALSHEIVGAAGHLGLALLSELAANVSHAARDGEPGRWVEVLLDARSASIGRLNEYCATRLEAMAG